MAKKAIEPMSAYKQFIDIVGRLDKGSIWNNNGTLLHITDENVKTIFAVDPELMQLIIGEKELDISDYDISNPEMAAQSDQFQFSTTGDDWLELDADKLYVGDSIELNVEGHDIPVIINRDLIPVKLKKAECNEIMYRVSKDTLGIKKRFGILPDHGFVMMRLYLIV